MSDDKSDRYKRGEKALRAVLADGPERMMEGPGRASPELVRLAVEFAYGDIFSRPGLDKKYRQIATVAALTAMANAPLQLKSHIEGALNVGFSREEVVEVIMQMAVYAGFPAALNGMIAADQVFSSLDRADHDTPS